MSIRPTKEGVLLRVNLDQKERAIVGSIELMVANKYKTNYRDKTPVVGIVEQDRGSLKAGTPLIVHHNLFQGDDSMFNMGNGLFSIPLNQNIFLRIDQDGEAHPMCGNIICERFFEQTAIPIPDAHKKVYNDRAVVLRDGYGYKKGEIVFHVKWGSYEIIYNWAGVEKRVIKVFKEDIVACMRK